MVFLHLNKFGPLVSHDGLISGIHETIGKDALRMAEYANQHYVPKYYFRQFNGGTERICLFLTNHGHIVKHAPIKGQCARHFFYGSAETERDLWALDAKHAATLRSLISAATSGDTSKFSPDDISWLLHGVLFQRARTRLEVEKQFPAIEAMLKNAFGVHLKATAPHLYQYYVDAVKEGKARITEDESITVSRQIVTALDSVELLLDLQINVIRNHSDLPFIFTEAPVVFYNSHYRQITDRGVLGFQAPGLQIFLPLTPTLQLMLIDENAYTGSFQDGPFCDIFNRADVSQLNALQVHQGCSAMYFGDPSHAEYVEDLFRAHRPCIKKPVAEFRSLRNCLIDGKPADGEVFQTFEPQLNHHLKLSFVDCTPLPPEEFKFRYRTPEVVEAHKRLRPYDGHAA